MRTALDESMTPSAVITEGIDGPLFGVADPSATRVWLDEAASNRFFAGAADPAALVSIGERRPAHRESIIRVADILVEKLPTPNSQLPTTGSVSGVGGWELGVLVDDPAVAWEPQRHQWLVRLAQAYALTGEHRYADACRAGLETWLDQQGMSSEADFTQTADMGGRLMSWCWTLMLARDAFEGSAITMPRALAALRQQAIHVCRSLSRYGPPPTHTTGNALALLYAGVLFETLPEAARWREMAVRVLVAQCDVQISTDGVHFEQSTCFHAYTADVYLHFLLLAARNRLEVPPSVALRVERMIDFLLAIRRPDGTIPTIGDADGGCLLPFDSRSAIDGRGRFAVAAALFHRPDFAWAAGGLTADVAWLMGAKGIRAFDALQPAPPASGASRIFPSGGYAVLRTGWEDDAHQMIMDVGPLGCPVSSGHGHADLLSIQCVVYGEPCLVDPGTHCYGGDSKWRDFFRSTGAHSTVVVDGAGQAESTGPFGWRRQPRARLREWHSTPDFDFVDAEHDGYSSLPDPVTHRRRVIFVKPGYWIIVDDLSGKARHQIDLTFQFAPGDVRLGAHPWARAATAGGPVLWISPFPSAPAQPALKCGEPSPIRGWISPEIAHLSPAPMLIYSFAVALPWRIVTLLLPDRQGLSVPPAVRPLYDETGCPHGFVFDRPRRVVRFDDRAVLVERD